MLLVSGACPGIRRGSVSSLFSDWLPGLQMEVRVKVLSAESAAAQQPTKQHSPGRKPWVFG
jgi:hypothetical protein